VGEVSLLTVVIAVVIGVVIWRASLGLIRMMSNAPPETDPTDIVEVDQDYRCSVCGAEVTMRAVNVREVGPPKHCREAMEPVYR
jgi:hypothetical protein